MSAHNNANNGRQRVFVYFAIHHLSFPSHPIQSRPIRTPSTLFHDHDPCFSPLRVLWECIAGLLALGREARTNRQPTRVGRGRARRTVNKPIRRNYSPSFSAFVSPNNRPSIFFPLSFLYLSIRAISCYFEFQSMVGGQLNRIFFLSLSRLEIFTNI